MKDNLRVILFATALAVVCAGLLTAANRLLADRQEANRQAEKWRTVFRALEVPFDESASAEQLLAKVRTPDNPGGVVRRGEADGLAFYRYEHPEEGTLRAFEFSGPGLWGPIEGLLTLRDDLSTIYNVSFYKHEETPGLGGEIEKPEFCDRFFGRTIDQEETTPAIAIVAPGMADLPNEIEGISGATMTCEKVATMLNRAVDEIRARREAIRAGGSS